jgi:hypothetical protein
MILCFTQEHAEYIIHCQSFQLDMTFARVRGEINDVVFTSFDERVNRGLCDYSLLPFPIPANISSVITLARAYVNKDSWLMYSILFATFFARVGQLTQQPQRRLQWKHIDGRGCSVLVGDCCFKQAIGNILSPIYISAVSNNIQDSEDIYSRLIPLGIGKHI